LEISIEWRFALILPHERGGSWSEAKGPHGMKASLGGSNAAGWMKNRHL
jgi:hypothetical protein